MRSLCRRSIMPTQRATRGIVSRPADQAMRELEELRDSTAKRVVSTPEIDRAEERRFMASQGAQVLQMANTYKR